MCPESTHRTELPLMLVPQVVHGAGTRLADSFTERSYTLPSGPAAAKRPALGPYVGSLKMAVGAPTRYQALPSGL
jgi:hypothetical protein